MGLYACSGKGTSDEASESSTEEKEEATLPISVNPVATSSYPDAMLEMYRPLGNEGFKEGKVGFEFNIKNYPFGQQRPLMLSINGQNPEAIPQAMFSKDFNKGTYRVIAYLTDEDGLILKDFGNYADRDFLVGDSRPFPVADEPYLMLNFPRDGQEIKEGEPLMVDFLVVWGDLQADGLKVKISLGDWEHETRKLEAFEIRNLSRGEHLLRAELLKADGSELSNAFSSVSRKVEVK